MPSRNRFPMTDEQAYEICVELGSGKKAAEATGLPEQTLGNHARQWAEDNGLKWPVGRRSRSVREFRAERDEANALEVMQLELAAEPLDVLCRWCEEPDKPTKTFTLVIPDPQGVVRAAGTVRLCQSCLSNLTTKLRMPAFPSGHQRGKDREQSVAS